ncbi:hypothetical protein [Streptomyces sp. AP-93]|uniref:hypothetical protein n=1 Tax=Streptomyces sp. AP-93 TaxID=2929048 RepID=UPI001FAFD5D2|nr:hypothetical protein [Streptomyces sp. AP-93]MCJ0871964.1 hypothetical protein [Streptomyces sp. AP-93]
MAAQRGAVLHRRRRIPVAAAVSAFAATCLVSGYAGSGQGSSLAVAAPVADGPQDGSCRTALPDSFWHAPVDTLPVHPSSDRYVSSIGAAEPLHPDFGAGLIDGEPFGIPITVSDTTVPESKVSLDIAGESDASGYRIPQNAGIENGPESSGDRHVVVWDRALCKSYELWNASAQGDNAWHAGSGAVFDLRSHELRPADWTSADAAGLAILPGLVRYEEAAGGLVDHAIRMTVPRTDRSYVWPARHQAGSAADASLPPMGLRLRLKSSVDTSALGPQAQAVAEALKKYGAIVADNGSAWYLTGEENPGWDNAQLNALKGFKGSDFEAVDASGLQQSPNSGAVAPR